MSDDKCEILFENEMAEVMEEIFADEDVVQEYAVSVQLPENVTTRKPR